MAGLPGVLSEAERDAKPSARRGGGSELVCPWAPVAPVAPTSPVLNYMFLIFLNTIIVFLKYGSDECFLNCSSALISFK